MPVENSVQHDYVQVGMLEDRYYMRQPRFRSGWWSLTIWLLIANVAAFIAQFVLSRAAPNAERYLALSIEGLSHGYVWQLLSFQFLHGGPIHLLLNCWMLFMFGREVEQALGRRNYLTLYFSSGVIGGLLQMLFQQALARVLHREEFLLVPVVGASAGVFGLIAAFATLYPERPLTLLLLYIIPVNMRAKFLLLLEAVISVLGMAFAVRGGGNGPRIADAAHLGGMVAGILFVRYAVHWQWPQFHPPRKRRPQRLVKVPTQKSALWGRAKAVPEEELAPEEFLSKEVDPILEKISAHGIQSLTERERRVLEAARQKMTKR